MRGAVVISAGLHGALILTAYFGLPSLFQRPDVANQPIPVELVTIAEETTPPPPKLKPEPRETEPPAPEPQPAVRTPPPAEVEVAAVAPEASEPEPEPVRREEIPEPAPVPEAKPEVSEPVPAPAAKPAARRPAPAPRRKPERGPKFDPDRIAALLDKSAEEPPRPRIEAEPEPAPEEAEDELPDLAARVRSRLDTISSIDLIRRQFRSCWSFPGGVRDPEGLIVTVRIRLKPDGSLSGEPQVVETDRLGEPNFRTAAEAAVRAVHKCAPLQQLPPLDYNEWSEIKLTFDPRELVGG